MSKESKTLKSRIILKHDTEDNWKKKVDFIPKESEPIVYDVDENNASPRLKIGDGVTNVNDLQFVVYISATLEDIDEICNTGVAVATLSEVTF